MDVTRNESLSKPKRVWESSRAVRGRDVEMGTAVSHLAESLITWVEEKRSERNWRDYGPINPSKRLRGEKTAAAVV